MLGLAVGDLSALSALASAEADFDGLPRAELALALPELARSLLMFRSAGLLAAGPPEALALPELPVALLAPELEVLVLAEFEALPVLRLAEGVLAPELPSAFPELLLAFARGRVPPRLGAFACALALPCVGAAAAGDMRPLALCFRAVSTMMLVAIVMVSRLDIKAMTTVARPEVWKWDPCSLLIEHASLPVWSNMTLCGSCAEEVLLVAMFAVALGLL